MPHAPSANAVAAAARMRVELGRGRGPLLCPDHREPEHAVTDERDDVDRRSGCVEPRKVVAERPPRPVEVRPEPVTLGPLLLGEGRIGRQRRRRVAAVADDLGRHALGQ